MKTEFINSITDISAENWDALWSAQQPSQYPFTRYAFLNALEASGSVDVAYGSLDDAIADARTGWIVSHLIVKDQDTLIAALPLFIKTHSYGEYVFDWSWADAYARCGMSYYPKLINAIPFTPATGPRFAIAKQLDAQQKELLIERVFSAIEDFSNEQQLSSFHCLFPSHGDARIFKEEKFICRYGYQFHWFNQGYTSFDNFLESFSSRKRKNLRKERATAQQHGLSISMHEAHELSEEDWTHFYRLYQRTYIKRSGHTGYLGEKFFHKLAAALPKNVLLLCVRNESTLVAGALFLRDEKTLYGRYWGSLIEYDQLHFEACYYQGIEYAIKNNIERFDPGAQGEHKIQRGFTPIQTCSYHRLKQPEFQRAVEDFVRQEKQHIDLYIKESSQSLPFKEGTPITDKAILL